MFVAFGGHLEREVELGDRWTFSVKMRSDAGIAALIGGDVGFDGDFGDGNFAASVGWLSRPDPTTKLTYVVPRPTGSRLEIGQLACSLALRSDGAELRASMSDSALVIDSSDNDGFIRAAARRLAAPAAVQRHGRLRDRTRPHPRGQPAVGEPDRRRGCRTHRSPATARSARR